MRVLIDAILGVLAFVSISIPRFTTISLGEEIAYIGIAILLAFLILMLHLKPQDNTSNIIEVVKIQNRASPDEITKS